MTERLSKADIQGLQSEYVKKRGVQLALCAKHEAQENFGHA